MMTAAASGHGTTVLFVSVAIVLVALAGIAAFAALPQGGNPQPFVGAKSTATESAEGLLLGLSLNETTITSGQTIAITVYERNTLQEINNVSASDKWPTNGLSVGPCGTLNMPFGIAVYSGNSSVLTVPGAQPLQLYEPGTYGCPAILKVTDYVFQPMSTELTGGPFNMSSTIDAKGYWGTTSLQSSFSDFSPGIYTIVAGDEWGSRAILSFQVEPSSEAAVGGLQIHVVQDISGQPVSGMTVVAGPASSKDDIALTPGGPTLKECVHGVPSGSAISNNGSTAVLPNGTTVTFQSCPVRTYTTNGTGWVSIPGASGPYFFFEVGTLQGEGAFGIVQLFYGRTTYLTVHVPSGNYTVTQ